MRRYFKLIRSPGIDYKESIPPAYVAWRAGTTTLFLLGSQPPRLYENSSTDILSVTKLFGSLIFTFILFRSPLHCTDQIQPDLHRRFPSLELAPTYDPLRPSAETAPMAFPFPLSFPLCVENRELLVQCTL